jgi:hypothetical protein
MVATSTDCCGSGCINLTVVPGVRAGAGMATQIRPSCVEVATPMGAPAAAICIAKMAATEIYIKFVAVRLTSAAHPQRLFTPHSTSPAGLGRCRVQPLVRRHVECYAAPMTIKARVRGGRLVVDEPTNLPEGTELELLPLDPGDWLDDADRAALHAALAQSQADVDAGRLVDAADILKRLRSS